MHMRNKPNNTLWLVFRHRASTQHSIERVFDVLEPYFADLNVSRFAVPKFTSGFGAVFKNILSCANLNGRLYHITGDIHYVSLGLKKNCTILTIHDCVFMHKYTGLKRKLFQWLFLKIPVARCAVITTISEFTKSEIIKFTGCKPEKIIVIPDPVDERFKFSPKKFCQNSPTILFIGTSAHKNLDRVIEAVSGINCKLNIIGKITQVQEQRLRELGICFNSSKSLSDGEVVDEYNKCDILLFPSTFEGFGLPILEAQQTGRVVITSDIPPMNAVAGDGAFFVNPYSIESIRNGLLDVISDSLLRQTLIERGLNNLELYRPQYIAERYRAIYSSF